MFPFHSTNVSAWGYAGDCGESTHELDIDNGAGKSLGPSTPEPGEPDQGNKYEKD